jgi:hypothetical protein
MLKIDLAKNQLEIDGQPIQYGKTITVGQKHGMPINLQVYRGGRKANIWTVNYASGSFKYKRVITVDRENLPRIMLKAFSELGSSKERIYANIDEFDDLLKQMQTLVVIQNQRVGDI